MRGTWGTQQGAGAGAAACSYIVGFSSGCCGGRWLTLLQACQQINEQGLCLQDLDIDFQLLLNAGTYDQLMKQLQRDCALLESLHVMDYSLLLGVHYLTWGPDEWAPPQIKVARGAMC